MKPQNRERGLAAERWVVTQLTQHGNRVLAQNYTVRGGEIDLIFQSQRYVVFLEIKLRPTLTDALAAITPAQQRRIRRTAQSWLAKHPSPLQPRFDTVALTPAEHGYNYQWMRNAF